MSRYAERPPRQVPGFADLQKMARILLSERVPDDGQVLVLGAGGGLELKSFAEAQPGWSFCGVDPSAQMLELARSTLGPLVNRVDFTLGYIDSAPIGPFDGATCLLTMHFLDSELRRHTLRELHRRLKPGAPLVVAHHAAPEGKAETWLARSAAFAAEPGAPRAAASVAGRTMAERLPLCSEAEEAALLREAGFGGAALFYAGFSFRGWVAYRD